MKRLGLAALVTVLLAAQGCKPADDRSSATGTTVLGSSGSSTVPGLVEVSGRLLSPPPVPRNTQAEIALVSPTAALAVWEEQGKVMAAQHHPARGWDTPRPLEAIHGEASEVRLASNGRGAAMAMWRHSVGRIDSLRFSRFELRDGWEIPGVVPGALPRPRQPGKTAGRSVEATAPRLEMDGDGNVRAEWLSGFSDTQLQVSTHVPGEGWARPLDLPVASAGQEPGRR